MPIKSRKFTDRKSAKEFADANNSKVERFNDPSGYFKYIVRLTESETKDKVISSKDQAIATMKIAEAAASAIFKVLYMYCCSIVTTNEVTCSAW